MLKILCLLGTVALGVTSAIADDEATARISLGGIRRVEATVSISGEDYSIGIRMLPVRCFDPATNTRINREKARLFALQSLAQWYREGHPASSGSLTVSGAVIENTSVDGRYYRLSLRVPRDSVKLVRAKKVAKPLRRNQSVTVGFARPQVLLTRKQDYLSTLEQLQDSLLSDVQELVSTRTTQVTEFEMDIAECEECGISTLMRLSVEVSGDKYLLSTERKEVDSAIKKTQRQFLNALRTVVEEQQQKLATEKSK